MEKKTPIRKNSRPSLKKVSKPRATKAPTAAVGAMEAFVYSTAGKKVNTIALPANIFGVAWKPDLVHQVTTALAANLRQNRAHTKDRAEVAGGGRKPWKQKGTGQARHGSTRSPLWRHGGVTFGPRKERDYHEKVNQKMRVGALLSVLSRKAKDGEIIFIDKFSFATPSTAEAQKAILAIAKGAGAGALTKNNHAALVALPTYDANAVKSFRNLGNIATEEVRNLNPLEVMRHRYLVIAEPEVAFASLTARAKK